MTDTFEFTLNNPLTEEQWDMIADVDFDHTDRIWFHTKHGKEVEFVKVRHAHWSVEELPVWGENTTEPWYTCSKCGYETKRSTPYCPVCGARMDEDETD